MTKLQLFETSFTNVQGIYHVGQIIEGHVIIQLSDTMKMRGVHLQFHGESRVEWTEHVTTGSGDNRRSETRRYSDSELYLNQEILLVGRWKHTQGDDIQLTTGRHVFPFAFQLPPVLPSSYEGDHGYVRYRAIGRIDKPWKLDHMSYKNFTIIHLLDLNREPRASTPFQASNSKQFCCLCCASGPVSLTLQLDRQAYVPGEAMLIKAEIDNKSNKKMISSSAVLTMETTYYAHGRHKTDSVPVASVVHGPVNEGQSDTWSGDALVIPAVPQSYLVGCNLIDIRYILNMKVSPSGLGFDLLIPVEIRIGALPLQQSQQQPTYSPTGQQVITAQPTGQPMYTPGPVPQPFMPPPYEQSMMAVGPPQPPQVGFVLEPLGEGFPHEKALPPEDLPPAGHYSEKKYLTPAGPPAAPSAPEKSDMDITSL